MTDKVKSWKDRLAQAKINLPVRIHHGMVLDAKDRTIILVADTAWAVLVVEALNNGARYDKVRQYIRAGTVSQLFPPAYEEIMRHDQVAESDMLRLVDEHIDSLADNWYEDAKPAKS